MPQELLICWSHLSQYWSQYWAHKIHVLYLLHHAMPCGIYRAVPLHAIPHYMYVAWIVQALSLYFPRNFIRTLANCKSFLHSTIANVIFSVIGYGSGIGCREKEKYPGLSWMNYGQVFRGIVGVEFVCSELGFVHVCTSEHNKTNLFFFLFRWESDHGDIQPSGSHCIVGLGRAAAAVRCTRRAQRWSVRHEVPAVPAADGHLRPGQHTQGTVQQSSGEAHRRANNETSSNQKSGNNGSCVPQQVYW